MGERVRIDIFSMLGDSPSYGKKKGKEKKGGGGIRHELKDPGGGEGKRSSLSYRAEGRPSF